MAKDLKFNIEAREQLKQGVDELANAVKEEIRCTSDYKGRCDRGKRD